MSGLTRAAAVALMLLALAGCIATKPCPPDMAPGICTAQPW